MSIEPGSIPGLCAVGRKTGSKIDLQNSLFPTTCPPDIPPKSRIVAVCGVTDWDDRAAPSSDGWFMSDFYLFHYLLYLGQGPTSSQFWMTSEDPEGLLKKYKEYAHGDPRGKRKVVLDEHLLTRIQQSGTLRIVPRMDLLERFLCTLREQATVAANVGEHLVILIFGHGEPDTYGVAIGGKGSPDDAPKLRLENIKRVLRPNVPVTLFMTSCYSGGWLVQPNTNFKYINATGIAAAGPNRESRSWPLSSSVGRASGSIIATAVLRSLIAIEESQQALEIRHEPTYMSLVNSIYNTYKRLDPFAEEQQIHFSAQDDAWETHYEHRIGMPLSKFKERWESLRSVPQGDYKPSIDSPDGALRHIGSIRKRSKVKHLARIYLRSHPGLHNLSPNVAFHGQLMSLMNGDRKFGDKEIDEIYSTLTYRLCLLHQANDVAQVMGVATTDAFNFSVEHWKGSAKEQELRSRAWRLLIDNQVLDPPVRAGLFYPKPWHFLSISLATSGLEWEGVQEKVALAINLRAERSNAVYSQWRGSQIAIDGEVVRRRQVFLQSMKNLGYRVKGVSAP